MDRPFVHVSPEELGIFLSCQEPTLAYNLPLLLPLGKEADFVKAKEAVSAILKNHPYLNMRLSMGKDGEVGKTIVDEPFELVKETLNELPREELVQHFDLLNQRLFRIRYLSTPEGDYLFSDFLHILMDGFSLKMYLDEFVSAYEGKDAVPAEAYDCIDDAFDKAKARADEKSFAEHT